MTSWPADPHDRDVAFMRSEKDSVLIFKSIDLDTDIDLCIRFRIDTAICAFGTAERFHEPDGKGAERYAAWLRARAELLPGSMVHLWRDEVIIGQIEMGLVPSDPSIGYVNLFYLTPETRGKGLGVLLEAYAWAYLSGLGCSALRLSVSPTNKAAWMFCDKHGWQDLGPRGDEAAVHLLEKRMADPQRLHGNEAVWTNTLTPTLPVPLILQSERLTLVPADVRLAGRLVDALNASYELHRDFLLWSQPYWSQQEAEQSLQRAAKDFFLPTGEKRYFVLSRSEAGQIVGCIGLLPRSGAPEQFEIGYWASQPHAGKGLMKEALTRMVAALSGYSLYLTAASANEASQRLAESVGFRRIDVIVGARRSEKYGVCDTFVYRRPAAADGAVMPSCPNLVRP